MPWMHHVPRQHLLVGNMHPHNKGDNTDTFRETGLPQGCHYCAEWTPDYPGYSKSYRDNGGEGYGHGSLPAHTSQAAGYTVFSRWTMLTRRHGLPFRPRFTWPRKMGHLASYLERSELTLGCNSQHRGCLAKLAPSK
jgi:hypothetical protein